jgi:hypothetical protein
VHTWRVRRDAGSRGPNGVRQPCALCCVGVAGVVRGVSCESSACLVCPEPIQGLALRAESPENRQAACKPSRNDGDEREMGLATTWSGPGDVDPAECPRDP